MLFLQAFDSFCLILRALRYLSIFVFCINSLLISKLTSDSLLCFNFLYSKLRRPKYRAKENETTQVPEKYFQGPP